MSDSAGTSDLKRKVFSPSEVHRRDDLHTDGMDKLSSPAVDSNWLDWSYLMERVICASIYGYVMNSSLPNPLPSHYDADKAKICSVFVRYVSPVNQVILQKHKGNPQAQWAALKMAHESNTAGSCIFWLEKLITFKMESNDVDKELTRVETIAERLSSLVTPKRPLTVDEILMMSLCVMLPPSFKPTIAPLLQRDSVTLSQLIGAIREELIVSDIKPAIEVAAVASEKKKEPERKRDVDRRGGGYCHFCRKSGHTRENCTRIEKRNKEREDLEKMKNELAEIKATLSKSKSSRSEKALVANEILLSSSSSSVTDDDIPPDSDFSYSVNHSTSLNPSHSNQVIDSGCSINMVPSSKDVSHLSNNQTSINLADGSVIMSTGKGRISPGFTNGTSQNAVVVPRLTEPLLSVSKLADNGVTTVFDKNQVRFYRDAAVSGVKIGQGVRRGGLYYLPKVSASKSTSVEEQALVTEDDPLLMWHRQLNHPCIQTLRQRLKRSGVDASGWSDKGVRGCRVCLQGKMRRRNLHSRTAFKAQKKFSVIHSDVSEYSTLGRDGSRFFVTFIDDFTKVARGFPIRHKSDVLDCFKKFKIEVESLEGVKISELRSDNGGEYVGEGFKSFCNEHGIIQTMGPPNTPQLNGVSERWNRTIKEKIRCSLIESGLPDSFWPFALSYCTETYNHLPTRTNASFTSPMSLSGLPERNINNLHLFGCEVWYHITNPTSKLAPRSKPGIFLSYLKNNKGIYLYDQVSRRLIKSTTNFFFDNSFAGLTQKPDATPPSSLPWPKLPSVGSEVVSSPIPTNSTLPLAPTRQLPARTRRPPDRLGEYGRLAISSRPADPKSYKQARKTLDWEKWRAAAVQEFESLIGKETWRLVPRPARRRIIRCKWVFKTKLHVDKSVGKMKARLVALRFSQVKRIDFNEVFSPTSRQESIRLLVSIMAAKNRKARSVDIKTAFLNGDLPENIYMEQPEGFVDPDHPTWVCQILQSLYGLKQSPRQWNAKLHEFLISTGLTQSSYDPSMYHLKDSSGLSGLIVVHVDDLAITGHDSFIKSFITQLKSKFEISRDEPLSHFLSLQISRQSNQQHP